MGRCRSNWNERTDGNFTLHKDAARTADFEETPGKWGGGGIRARECFTTARGKETLCLEEAKKFLPFRSAGFVRGSIGRVSHNYRRAAYAGYTCASVTRKTHFSIRSKLVIERNLLD